MKSAGISPQVLDRVEQVLIVAAWAYLGYRAYASPNPLAPLLAFSELIVVVFTLVRRPTTAITVRFSDWIVAFAASLLPMFIDFGGEAISMEVGAAFILTGMTVQLSAKLFLRRSFGITPAHRGLKMDGPYRLLRHPMYAGYLVSHMGTLLISPNLWNVGIYLTAAALLVYRVVLEERVLSTDPDYVAYSARVRYRLVPGLF
jgi:protein-S-isoprenylcysteine O-methyltransferase Ste14